VLFFFKLMGGMGGGVKSENFCKNFDLLFAFNWGFQKKTSQFVDINIGALR
jgi:hypothetical protein